MSSSRTKSKNNVVCVALVRVFKPSPSHEKKAVILAMETLLTDINRLLHGKSKEIIRFTIRNIALGDIAAHTTRHAGWDDMGYVVHWKANDRGLISFVITNDQYRNRTAGICVSKLLTYGEANLPAGWVSCTVDRKKAMVPLDHLLKEFQVPEAVDKLLLLRREVEETREVVIENIDKLIARGRKLEEVVKQAEDLSAASKMFVTEAKRTNRCRCVVF
eukprot:gnl/Dysnectes_brevis/1315_a1476_3434.p1 GENE.gnl/Dysnectes_brevis/1315_a1476_3434~~gnl/Dysnectes_brevis/1315_a1476_3434.p1  ORF type:complete len:218 (-),score=42.95 gnl/Dysnectes_brevis/1315_a1476_3434:144-797(-)